MEEPDILAVVAEVQFQLVEALFEHSDDILWSLCKLAEPETCERLWSVADRRERILRMVDYFRRSRAACLRFVNKACIICSLPMDLDSQLVYAAGPHNHQPDEPPLQWPGKRLRRDYVGCYCNAVKRTLQQKYERLTQGVASVVRLDQARVSLRQRTASKPRGERAPTPSGLQEGEEGSVEDVVTVDTLLSSLPSTPLTVLVGPAGSGKTVLMHCVGQRWARGELPNFQLLFLLEFRQLNLVTRKLSLRELLFHFFPLYDDTGQAHSDEEEEGGEAVLIFMLANPEKVCVIFDGYDEFRSKFAPWKPDMTWDPQTALSILELFSGLCSGRILGGCSVLLTCRPRNMVDLPNVAMEGELLGFDWQQVVEYAEQYFREKGHGGDAVRHLQANRRVLTMCYVPALCHLCCVCLDYLFSHRPCPPSHLPVTITQVYLHILTAFLSRAQVVEAAGRAGGGALQRHRAELKALCQLAMQGLEDSTIVFSATEVPPELLVFATRVGLLSQFELTWQDGSRGMGCTFMHLAMQEFLGALHLMTSDSVDEPQIRKKLNLKTRWTARSDPKTVFTDTLHLYVCGLAAPACTLPLAQVVGGGSDVASARVQRRQSTVLKILRSFAGSAHLTGPKLMELCHCAHETRDAKVAEAVGARPSFELRNIRLAPTDMDALAFVVSAAGRSVGLDFGGCSMEPECLQALPSCHHVDYLIFRSRKYGDAFAEVLAGVLPRLPTLRKLEVVCGSLTEAGAEKLATALESCPEITELNLGKNSCSVDGILSLLEKMVSYPGIQAIRIDGQKEMSEIKVLFSQSCFQGDGSSEHAVERTVSLRNFSLTADQMNSLCQILAKCPGLSVIDLSGSKWEEDVLSVLADALQTLTVSREILMNRSTVSQEALVVLARILVTCPNVCAVDVRLQEPIQVSVLFSQEAKQIPKRLRLVACGLCPAYLSRLCETLIGCPALTLLDLSGNALGDKGLKKLIDFLPQLSEIQEIDFSDNAVNMEGVLLLAGTLCTCKSLHEVEVSHIRRVSGESQEVTTLPENGIHLYKKLSLTHSKVPPSSIDKLCGKLAHCPGLLDLNFFHSSLGDKAIEKLLKYLPVLSTLQLLDMSHVQMSTESALLLVRSLIDCQRVRAVELRPQGEAFIKFLQVRAEEVTCKLTQYQLTRGNVEKLSGILQQCSRISDLDLSSNVLKDEGVKRFVEDLPKLHISSSVKLNDNKLTQTGVLSLVNSITVCKRVVAVEASLGIEKTSLIRFIEDNNDGKALSLRECDFGAIHLQKLADILQNCSRLVRLDLCCNTLQNEGLKILQRSLTRLPSLQILGIRSNRLSAQAIEDLVKDLGCHTTILTSGEGMIEEPWIREEAAAQLVSRSLDINTNIRSIRVNKTTVNITLEKEDAVTPVFPRNDSMEPTSNLSAVLSIGLVDCGLQGRHLYFLHSISQKCPQLQELDLSHNSINRKGAEILGSTLPAFANLRRLWLQSSDRTSEDGVKILSQGLSQCHYMESLSLAHHVICDEGAASLRRTLPKFKHLRAINLSCCSLLTVAGSHDLVLGLGQCTSLEDISLDSVQLDAEGIAFLATGFQRMAAVKRLILNKITLTTGSSEQGDGAIIKLLESLEGFQRMEEIELDEVRMGDRGVQELVRHLCTWQRLRRISLSKNSISDEGGEMLAQALGHCTILEELILSRNSLAVTTAAKLGQVLPLLSQLRTLDLSENIFGMEGAMKLSECLVQLKSLKKLHLVSIGTHELTGLAASLGHCVCAEEVSLAWNSCGDTVAVKLAAVLPRCQKLKCLDLECNKISSAGAEELAKSLRFCPSIEVIRLWKNCVRNEVAQRLQAEEPRMNFSST
ncbi:hypothetical protein AGOR_G00168850 [Albula goreensis]|uniref:NACHT domain-containing protein n=1 Tax=Albula goreensis TaxID=1534307 RepID=A0A8T3D5T2_9TELE|nr:hypothetical protein AGOR_G00168850 [Albula goreensis]